MLQKTQQKIAKRKEEKHKRPHKTKEQIKTKCKKLDLSTSFVWWVVVENLKRKRERGWVVQGKFFFFFCQKPSEKWSCGDPKLYGEREREREGHYATTSIDAENTIQGEEVL